ncbi:MAG: nucleoside-diphosphate sugar epimerase/dehydratase [Thermoguttaceae bacterium]|jgi:FlaA1/EpsC-like NDP-sugar epimerase
MQRSRSVGQPQASAEDGVGHRSAAPGDRSIKAALRAWLHHGLLRRSRNFLNPRAWLLAAGHLVVFALMYWLAFVLRFELPLPAEEADLLRDTLLWVLAVKFVVFLSFGHYEGWWAYVTFADLIALVRTSLLATFVIAASEYFFGSTYYTPRKVLILDCVGVIAVLGGLRGSWRFFQEQFWPIFNQNGHRGALLVGTDHLTGMLAHQIQACRELPYRVRGLLTLDDSMAGSRLGQIPILGKLEDVRDIAAACKATDVLLTAGTLAGPRMRNLMNACAEAGLQLKIIRRAEDRLSGDHRIPLRDIEISDLLRRATVQLDMKSIGHLVEGRTIMVTGAGGSIGAEICRQLLRFNPRKLLLVGRGENRIFKIERKLRALHTAATLCPVIADITDQSRMRQVFTGYRPEVVFHAAAHKHVPLMEENVGEAVRNNVCGTNTLVQLAHEFQVRNFVFISTDKAVRPTSVMGISKQLAERCVHAQSQVSATKFTVVRFGNVLGSDGSVVPIFQEQIRRGGPITVTDPRMTRFFMTIPEASQLVLQAAAMGHGGEIFVLEMGEPVKIVDLARDLIRLSGLPEDSIEICFTGVRPGEKLYEELYFEDEETLPTAHPKLRAAYHRPYTFSEVQKLVASLQPLIYGPADVLRLKLEQIVREFAAPGESAGENGALSPDQPAAQTENIPIR